METNGISPKVYVPVLINTVGAVALYLVGEKELAVGVILAVLSSAGLGYGVSPGAVDLDEDMVAEIVAAAMPVPDGPESD